ncbi:MAG: GNAT family N-acetyltransferase [Levilactobacillus sp.]|uniref:GNAT family N-acetyltransferase n=1 Tax=Levilactobacillus suantsaiihabitans TaxID=2487722 RepID=A0A4Z0JBM7_9LACO|nr:MULTISPECIES: GNAT family N-acetyltransferase [Levilactobacillus]MCH4123644.1 GNAT family N-acetyltransferase [Levilactobacillus sp.]MCI1553742.1 GNAT family N-acetyltransferase [Levilactobacillus sp.]MCI1599696.1 GNAT family N-acetyltransferase [Levilactobacillus sp.]MCI1605879.1 GNAT family N-acetyltransferase [Levilactobacillus sp.]TGD20215.1 GNAT family N-acetyltransferase [Levilactobacillus suantsaiihabitans]
MEIRMAWGKLNPVFKDALQMRKDVFIEEQGIDPKVELDGTDEDKMHYVGYVDDEPVTTARIDMLAGNRVKIQRVATVADQRKHGYAAELIKQIIKDAKKSDVAHVELDAQLTAMDFYKELGFEPIGEPFEEAGIQHQTVRYAGK